MSRRILRALYTQTPAAWAAPMKRRDLPAAAFDRYHHPYQWWMTTPKPGELEYLGGAHNRMRAPPTDERNSNRWMDAP